MNRGWVIIGLDLLIVLGIYFLYLTFANTNEPSAEIKRDVIYRMEARKKSDKKIQIEFLIKNTLDESVKLSLPDGIRLQLTDGKRVIYWKKSLIKKTNLTISNAETRSWNIRAPAPDNPPQNLYAEFVIDKNRQGRVTVQTSS